MDKNTKFLMVVMVILAIVTLVFVIYISSQDSIIRQKEDPKEIIKEITENQEVESTKLNTPITEHKSAEEEINDILEKDFVNETGVSYRVTLLGFLLFLL